MKTLLRLLVGFCLTACVALASAELSAVSFVVAKQQFKAGDSVVIDQVLATSPKLDVGAKVTVRGHYKLASAASANLGLYVTHRSPAGADAVAPSQVQKIQSASGSFELSCEMTYDGDLHVSLYPASGGESFGGVYFSAKAQKS